MLDKMPGRVKILPRVESGEPLALLGVEVQLVLEHHPLDGRERFLALALPGLVADDLVLPAFDGIKELGA